MLNLDEERFVRIQTGAVEQAEPLRRIVRGALEAGAENLWFLGSGGAGILMDPAVRLLQARSTLPVHTGTPAEVLVTRPVHLTGRSLVVIPSLSGTTTESVQLLDRLLELGSTVVVLTAHADTPLGERATHTVTNFAEDDTSSESFYLQSLLVALAVLDARGEVDDHDVVVAELRQLPQLLLEVKRAFEPQAEQLAQRWRDVGYHVFVGAGSAWAETWYFAMCILEEMQWVRTRPVNAADFFHGTLELVEPGVSVVLLKGEDETRPLAERVERFVPQHTDDLVVLDTADLALPGISARTRSLVSPVLLATVLERVAAHLEVLRDHPLTTRRYYKRVAY